MARHDAADIISMVDEEETNFSERHQLMDEDWNLWLLTKYAGHLDEDGKDVLAGFEHYTSPEPRSFAEKLIYLIVEGILNVRVHPGNGARRDRETDNFNELVALGMMSAADERRRQLLQPSIISAKALHACVRGWITTRTLLVKPRTARNQPPRQSYVSIESWDPRNTYFNLGPDGVEWACHKTRKTRKQIQAAHRVDIPADSEDSEELDVYDFYDDTHNTVVTQGATLKKSTRHGMVRNPVNITPVGPVPMITNMDGGMRDWGQSIYSGARGAYENWNFTMSIFSELMHRSISQGLLIFSEDGTLTFQNDPRRTGSDVSLVTDRQDVKALPPMEMVRQAMEYLGLTSGEAQRATISHVAYGDIPGTLSSLAIKTLRQGMGTKLKPVTDAITDNTLMDLNLLMDTYRTGRFGPMIFSGFRHQSPRDYFTQVVQPEDITDGVMTVELLADLPTDDAQDAQTALMLTQGETPLVDLRYAREHNLKIQNVDAMEDAVLRQRSQTASPAAAAHTFSVAAGAQGDEKLAQIWLAQNMEEKIKNFLEIQQLRLAAQGMMAPRSPGGNPNGGNNGSQPANRPAPRTLPAQAQGVEPDTSPGVAPPRGPSPFGPNGAA